MLQTQYQQYNSSWDKFAIYMSIALPLDKVMEDPLKKTIADFSYVNSAHQMLLANKVRELPFTQKIPGILSNLIGIGYFAHNLYSQYIYNKSLEKEITLELPTGDIIQAEVKPQYLNTFTAYNIAGIAYCGLLMMKMFININDCSKKAFYATYGLKLIDCFASNYADYTFINKEDGSILNSSTIEDSTWIH